MTGDSLTPIQRAMLDVLSDGKPHSHIELKGCIPDELATLSTVRVHICTMRPKLRERGEGIMNLRNGKSGSRYVLVRYLRSPYVE